MKNLKLGAGISFLFAAFAFNGAMASPATNLQESNARVIEIHQGSTGSTSFSSDRKKKKKKKNNHVCPAYK